MPRERMIRVVNHFNFYLTLLETAFRHGHTLLWSIGTLTPETFAGKGEREGVQWVDIEKVSPLRADSSLLAQVSDDVQALAESYSDYPQLAPLLGEAYANVVGELQPIRQEAEKGEFRP
ncbi:unnamed protein product, partial [marine sediment metagenome]